VTPTLSILLATVTERAALFEKLHSHIQSQAAGKPVEVLVACDNKEISIGRKRGNLLAESKGEYVCYVDDDDWVADDYVDRILSAVSGRPDCVGFKIHCTTNGGNPVMACASMRYPEWGENKDGFAHVRSTYHKTPVRAEIAHKVGFRDLRFGEDKIYSIGVMRLVKTEEFINHVMYYYRYRREPFIRKYGFSSARDAARNKGVNTAHVRRPFQH